MPDNSDRIAEAVQAEYLAEKPADLKAARNQRDAKTGTDRPKLSILPYNGMVHGANAVTYGAAKYARGNYFGPPPAAVEPVDRFLEYLDAAMRHIGKIAHAINIAKGTGGDQRAACALPDDEASGGFPASNLPHIAHAIAGLMIAVECGVNDGLLPADPGQPWKSDPLYAEVLARRAGVKLVPSPNEPDNHLAWDVRAALAQKDGPDAEHRRVARRCADGKFVDPAKVFTPETLAAHAETLTKFPVDRTPAVGDRVQFKTHTGLVVHRPAKRSGLELDCYVLLDGQLAPVPAGYHELTVVDRRPVAGDCVRIADGAHLGGSIGVITRAVPDSNGYNVKIGAREYYFDRSTLTVDK
jgi:Domain of unknown function (DUF5664)